MFAVWKVRQLFSQSERADSPLPLFVFVRFLRTLSPLHDKRVFWMTPIEMAQKILHYNLDFSIIIFFVHFLPVYSFQCYSVLSFVFHNIETSHLICNANQMTGFCIMKWNTGLKLVLKRYSNTDVFLWNLRNF